MPPSHEMATDDYVAELLAKEAGDCSLKYSAMGLDAFKLNKRPANQPKPNTRFLNNIIRDTTSHNRALLAKENAESRARLRDLEEADRRKRDEEERKIRRSRPGPSDTRKRMLGDIAAILGGPTKRRKPNDKENTNANITSDRDEPDDRYDRGRKGKSRETRRAEDEAKPTSRRPARDRRSDSRDRHSRSRRHEERPRDRRSSPHETRDERERRPKHKERSPRGRDKDGRHRQHRRPERGERRAPEPAPTRDDDSGSDPLDDIIGPAPPPKATVRRGRGLNAAMSGIDSRFAADYDPTVDVTPDPDEAAGGGGDDDWDGAAEAFLDRQKWKQQGAERLRSAGFTEDQIRKWEKGDGKGESDVQWNKAGRVREWDRGKVVDADTNANVGTSPDPEFGRLKGT